MWLKGKYYNDIYLNRLLQVTYKRNEHLLILLEKPIAWQHAIRNKPIAVRKLRSRILEPLPASFLKGTCREYEWFKNYATNSDITTIEERQQTVENIIKLVDSFHWLSIEMYHQEILSNLKSIGQKNWG